MRDKNVSVRYRETRRQPWPSRSCRISSSGGVVVALAPVALGFLAMPLLSRALERKRSDRSVRFNLIAEVICLGLTPAVMRNLLWYLEGGPSGTLLLILEWVVFGSALIVPLKISVGPVRGISERVSVSSISLFYLIVAYWSMLLLVG